MKNFLADEELYYALSFLFENGNLNELKLDYFADFIENLVFSNELYMDSSYEKHNTPTELPFIQLMDYLKLDSVIKHIDINLTEFEFKNLKITQSLLSNILDHDKLKNIDFSKRIGSIVNSVLTQQGYNVSEIDDNFMIFCFNVLLGNDFYEKLEEEDIIEGLQLLGYSGFTDEIFIKKLKDKDFVNYLKTNMYPLSIGLMIEPCLQIAKKNNLYFLPMKNYSSIVCQKPFYNYSNKVFIGNLKDLINEEEKKLYNLFVEDHICKYNQPLIFNYIVSKASSKHEIVEIALELRHSKEVINFQKWCNNVDEALRNGMRKEANNMVLHCEEFIQTLRRKNKTERKVSLSVTFPPALTIDLKKNDFKEDGHNFALLKDIYNNTLTPSYLKGKLEQMK